MSPTIPALHDDYSFPEPLGEKQEAATEVGKVEMSQATTSIQSANQAPNAPMERTTMMPSSARPSRASRSAARKATATRDQYDHLPASKSSSVFTRLYKTQTAASKAWMPARAQARAGTGKGGVDDASKVFERLHITSTYSNSCKRKQQRQTSRFTPEKPRMKVMRSPAKTPSSSLSTSPRKNYVYSPRMKPLTKLYFDSKYHPGLGVETVEPIKLGFSFFQCFCEYENGGIGSNEIAREIILAFFKKDFPAGR